MVVYVGVNQSRREEKSVASAGVAAATIAMPMMLSHCYSLPTVLTLMP